MQLKASEVKRCHTGVGLSRHPATAVFPPNLATPRNYTIFYERWIYAAMNNDSSGHRNLYVILFDLAA